MITIKTDDFTGGKTVNTHLVKIEEFISVETYSEVPFFRLKNKMPNGLSEMRDLDFFDLMYIETEGGAGLMVIRVISDFLKAGQWPNWYDSWPMIVDGERVALKSTTQPDFQSNYELRAYELPVDVFSKLCNAKEVRYSLRGQSRKTEGAFSAKHLLLFQAFQEYCFGDESQGKIFLNNLIRPIENEEPAHDIVLTHAGVNSISIVSLVKKLSDVGVSEAKDLVDNVPSIIKTVTSKEEAIILKSQLEDGGAKAEILFGSQNKRRASFEKLKNSIFSEKKSQAVVSASIKGIIQSENGNPVKGVEIILCVGHDEYKANSKLDGTFEIKNLPQVKFDILLVEDGDGAIIFEEIDLSKDNHKDFGIIKVSKVDVETNIQRQPEITNTAQSNLNTGIEGSVLTGDLESKINSILKMVEGLNKMSEKIYLKGRIDPKKWRNFTNQYQNVPIGNIDDCYVYFDNTIFGSGDDGFMLTKNLFCFKNKFEKPLCLYNHPAVEGFNQKAETMRFYNLGGSDIGVVNGASMHSAGESPGFRVDSNKALIDIPKTVDLLNKLLQVIKAG